MSIVVVTYARSTWYVPFVFELEADHHRVHSITRFEELPDHCIRPSHFVPWFLMDMLGEADPSPVMFISPQIQLTSDLLKAGLEASDSDMAVPYKDNHPTSDVVYLSNTDITRDLLDAWIEQNDRNPGREADVNLREIVRRYRTRVRIKKLDRKVLHDRPVACTIR